MVEAPEPEVVSNQPPTSLPSRVEGTPYTSVKVIPERTPDGQMARHTDITKRVQQMREAGQEDALGSARHFFAPGNGQDQVILIGPSEEVPFATTGGTTVETSMINITSTVPTTSTTTTVVGAGMGSPSPFFLNESPSRPTATATCRP